MPDRSERALSKHDIVVVGGSAGSLQPLQLIAKGLRSFRGTVLVVIHTSPEFPSMLAHLLNRYGTMPADKARDGDVLEPGRIFVAVSNRHLVVVDGKLRLEDGPRENRARPAIDVLFRSAAKAYGDRVVGVLLSGMLDDGTEGLANVKAHGGIAVVQDPLEALHAPMPQSAVDNVEVDYVLPASGIAPLLHRLNLEGSSKPTEGTSMSEPDDRSRDLDQPPHEESARDLATDRERQLGEPSALTCPLCHGAMASTRDAVVLHFRCHTGHAFSPMALGQEQDETIERELESMVRAMKERAVLTYMMVDAATARGAVDRATKLERHAQRFELAVKELTALRKELSEGDEPLGDERRQ